MKRRKRKKKTKRVHRFGDFKTAKRARIKSWTDDTPWMDLEPRERLDDLPPQPETE